MLRIVTDGAADMPPEWPTCYEVHVIPINIHFGERTFLQGVNLSDADFYRLVEEHGVIPKTSQPTPQQFVAFYRRIAKPGDTILSIHVTSKLSGTYESAVLAAREVADEFRVIPFDSGNGSAGLGFMCREAREMERAGYHLEHILERLEDIRRNIQIVLTLDNLDYARMSGRVKALQAALASLLNVKAVVELRDGILDMADKVRTRNRALRKVLQMVKERLGNQLVNVAVVHACDPKAGASLLAQVRDLLHYKELVMTDLSIAVAANLGPGTVGIVAYPVRSE